VGYLGDILWIRRYKQGMKTGFSTALGWVVLGLAIVAWRPPSETPPVDRNSNAIRAVLAQPITSDPGPLRIARQKLAMAKDEAAAKAIDLYLAGVAVRQVFGEATEAKGTVADIVEGRVATPSTDTLASRVLDNALRVELAAEPVSYGPDKGDIQVHIALRNVTARPIVEERFELKVGRTALSCIGTSNGVPIDANAAVAFACTTHASLVTPAQLESYLKEPAWVRASVSYIKFGGPSLYVNKGIANWANDDRVFDPWQTARTELDALSCWERSACLRDSIPTLDTNPGVLFAGVFAGAGLLAGSMLAFFTRRRWRWAWSLAGLVAGSILALFAFLMMANSMGGLIVMIYGPLSLGGFLVGLLPPLFIIKGRHPQ
jgi:hypothetical protein